MLSRKVFCDSEINLIKTLDAIIKSRGLARDFVGRATDISPASLSHFFNCNSGLSFASLERLCQFLGVPHIQIAAVPEENQVIVPLEVIEHDQIHKALKAFNWNIDSAHKALGCTKYYLYSRIQKYGFKKP